MIINEKREKAGKKDADRINQIAWNPGTNHSRRNGMGGGTYAKSLPNTVAFGSIFPGREDTMHQANEYIDIKDLLASSRIYAKAMMKLANL